MARTASMTRSEAEANIGPRGSLAVTLNNRTAVRKWLVAAGVPSVTAGTLPMHALQTAYNDTTDKVLANLLDGNQTAREEAAASIEAPREQANGAANGHAVNGHDGAHDQHMQRVTAAVVAALAAMPPAVNPDEIKAAAERAAAEAVARMSLTADAIRALVAEEAPKHVMVHRIDLTTAAGEIRKIDGHQHPNFAALMRAAASRQADGYHPNIWLAGPAGSGKTYAAKTVAAALDLAFHFNGALSMPHELLGFIDAGGRYHRTPFRDAYEHGGIYLFDEVDGSDNAALLALNAALANGRATFPDGQVKRHENSVIVATANTWGLGATADYVGRSKIDAAFLSRFPIRIGWDYDENLERAISGNADFAKRVQKARAKARAAGLKILIDPRASIAGAAMIAAGFSPDEAAAMTYMANLSAEQRKTVEA